MEQNKSRLNDFFLIALKYSAMAMVLNISIALYVDNETGELAQFLNLISFSFLYGVFLFYTVNTVKVNQKGNITFKHAFLVGILYLLLSGLIQAFFTSYIKYVDIEEIRKQVTTIWENNNIPLEQINAIIHYINKPFIFIATLIGHVFFGLFSLVVISFLSTKNFSKPSKKDSQ